VSVESQSKTNHAKFTNKEEKKQKRPQEEKRQRRKRCIAGSGSDHV